MSFDLLESGRHRQSLKTYVQFATELDATGRSKSVEVRSKHKFYCFLSHKPRKSFAVAGPCPAQWLLL